MCNKMKRAGVWFLMFALLFVLMAGGGCGGGGDDGINYAPENPVGSPGNGNGGGATPPVAIQWEKTYGGTGNDTARSMRQTRDGGYIVAGESDSRDGDAAVASGRGTDGWVIKLNAQGDLVNSAAIGGNGTDRFNSIVEVPNGGFIAAGYASSTSPNIYAAGAWSRGWIVTLDKTLNRTGMNFYGDIYSEYNSLVTMTGAYAYAAASDNVVDWFDSSGQLLIQTATGPNGSISALLRTSDGGRIEAGSDGNDSWLAKYDLLAEVGWTATSGYYSKINSIAQLKDGTFVCAVFVGSSAIRPWGLFKLAPDGTILWEKDSSDDPYADEWRGIGRADDYLQVAATNDGGFVVALTEALNEPATGNYYGYPGTYLMKYDSAGNKTWQITLAQPDTGIRSHKEVTALQQTSDGGFVVAGTHERLGGNRDFWIVKLR